MITTSKLKVFFDGACPICAREISWLRKRTGEEQVHYIDTSAHDFSSSEYYSLYNQDTYLMQALLPDNSSIYGVEVFRQLYHQAGLGWLLAPTSWPLIKPCVDFAYKQFAKRRKQLTGRGCTETTCG